VPEGYEPVPFFEGISARILRRLANNPFNLRVLRDMVYGDSLSRDTRDFAAERVIRQVATWLSEGRLRLVQPSQPQYAVLAKKEAPPPEPEEEATPTSWVGIELVDQDGKPVPEMRFRLKLPDGTYKEGLTDKAGRFRINGIAEGSCTLEFPSLDAEAWKPA
jgi:hypothetical protein